MLKGILIVVIGIIIIIVGGFQYLRGMVEHQKRINTFEQQKYLNDYLQNYVVLERGKVYRIEGNCITVRHKEDGGIGYIEFIAGNVVFFRIGCVANFDTLKKVN